MVYVFAYIGKKSYLCNQKDISINPLKNINYGRKNINSK